MKTKLLLLVSSIVAGPLVGALLAQETPFSGELSVGWSTFSLDNSHFAANTLTVTSADEKSIGYGLRGAYQFSPRWGMELGYIDTGYMNVRGLDSTGRGWSTNIHTTNWIGGATARHAVNERLTLSGRGGLLGFVDEWGKSEVVRRLLPDQDRGVKYYLGVSLEWKLRDRFALMGSVDRYFGNQKPLTFSAGLKAAF